MKAYLTEVFYCFLNNDVCTFATFATVFAIILMFLHFVSYIKLNILYMTNDDEDDCDDNKTDHLPVLLSELAILVVCGIMVLVFAAVL